MNMMESNFSGMPQKREFAPSVNLEGLRNIDRKKLRPEIDEILGQLIASEEKGTYSEALADFDSNDEAIKNHALEYLQPHQEFLMDAVDTLLRMGFSNPEEKMVSDEANTRLGVIFGKFERITH